MPKKNSFITVTDQFCGAGGTSIGATLAGAEVRLAMNHWQLAIDTHNTNFPNTDHDCADISASNPRKYPSTDILTTSPECTNHSLAKGKPRRYYEKNLWGEKLIDESEERSRATMWDVPRFAEYHQYRIIIVENVVDAVKWRMWDAWLHAMHLLGYEHEVVYFNSMFALPVPQSRDRIYVVFWKKGNKKPDLDIRPVAHCQNCGKNVGGIQTWKKKIKWGRYKQQYIYRCPDCHKEVVPYFYAGFNAIDWTIPSVRIGDRKKPLKPKTVERIKYGLDMFGRQALIITGRYTSGLECRVRNANMESFPTQPGDSSHALLLPWMIDGAHTNAKSKYSYNGDGPFPVQTTAQTMGIVSSGFLTKNFGGAADPKFMSSSLAAPTGTMTTSNNQSLITFPPEIQAKIGVPPSLVDGNLLNLSDGKNNSLLSEKAFLSYYYGTMNASGLDEPVGAMTTHERVALVQGTDAISIDDLFFRMLQPVEVGNVMAFPQTYKVLGTGRQQVKQFGNAVTPPVMEILIARCMATFN